MHPDDSRLISPLPTQNKFEFQAHGVKAARSPIFVTADEPLLIFSGVSRMLGYLEWQDVEAGLYRGYDRDGRLITFSVAEERRRRRVFGGSRVERSVAITVEPEPAHADELRAALGSALSIDAHRGSRMSPEAYAGVEPATNAAGSNRR
jgi:hypothetical protein